MEFREGGVATSPPLLHYAPHGRLRAQASVVMDYVQLAVSTGAVLSFVGGLAGVQITWRESLAALGGALAAGVKRVLTKR